MGPQPKEATLKKIALAVLMSAVVPLMAAEPTGVVVWSGSELKGYGKKLAPKMNEGKVATERLATFPAHFAMVAHREGDGQAELHEKQADLFVVESGEATLVYGGEVVSPKTTEPHEVRGPSIKGGEKKALAVGDVVHIPARIPHQLLVPAGKEFTYFVVKVDTP
jgi:mannose-6-phosphate isomerase-like protein (cupin superfamily)